MNVNEELKFLRKFTQKNSGVGGGRFGGGGGGLGGCERKSEVFVKIQNKKMGGGGVGGQVGGGGGGRVMGVRVDVNREVKFL